MSSQLGYLPKEMKTLASGIQVPTDGTVLYNSPTGFHLVSAVAGAATLTPRQILGGFVLATPGAAVALTMPDADDFVAAFNGAQVGSSVRFSIKNLGAATEIITVTASASITKGTAADLVAIDENQSAEFLVVLTNVTPGSEAAEFYTLNLGATQS